VGLAFTFLAAKASIIEIFWEIKNPVPIGPGSKMAQGTLVKTVVFDP